MSETNFKSIKKAYEDLKVEQQKYKKEWSEISKYTGIKLDVALNNKQPGEDLDIKAFDPTAALSTQQAADYTKGIVWGDGQNVFEIIPPNTLTEVDDKLLKWYDKITKITLEQMNHINAGLNAAMSAFQYDQQSFGTSGIGAFKNSSFFEGKSTNALIFRAYGVDTLCIDEGKNGLVEYVYNTYLWTVNRIVSEFCKEKEKDPLFKKLPKEIQESYKQKELTQKYEVISAIIPNDAYVPGAEGIKGCKYIGHWFTDKSEQFFYTEYYKERPINISRAEKIRGEKYGRASGTILISAIRAINAAVGMSMEAMDKTLQPPLCVYSGSIWGDSIVDTSTNGLTTLNPKLSTGQNPIFPLYQVGDISTVFSLLLPYLTDKITTGYKVDMLLDFNAKSNMTATESLERTAIRDKSISGILMQQKIEVIEPLITRCVSILLDAGLYGTDSISASTEEDIIPDEVFNLIQNNEKWFEIKFKNTLGNLSKAEKIDDFVKLLNTITAIMSVYPEIRMAIDWYGLLSDISEVLGHKKQILSKEQFMAEIQAEAIRQQQAQAVQMAQIDSQTNKNNAQAYGEVNGYKNA